MKVHPNHYTQSGDPDLERLLPASVETISTNALPLALTRHAGLRDVGIRAYPHLRLALARLLATRKIDAALLTGAPFFPLALAAFVRRRGCPVVLDFQDPWVSSYARQHGTFSKAGIAHQLASWLEPHAVRHASWITSVSDIQNEEMRARYPGLDPTRMTAIPIGGDPDDFDALRRKAPATPAFPLDQTAINLSYVGTFLPKAAPLVRVLFAAVDRLRGQAPFWLDRLRLNFVGTSNQPDGTETRILPLARQAGVEEFVRELPRRVPFLDALDLLARSDGLLLIGSDEPHYTASKIYPALMSGTPFLSLFHAKSSAHDILASAGGGRALAFGDSAELERLIPVLTQALVELIETPKKFGRAAPQAYQAYTAHAVSGRFADVLDVVVRSPSEDACPH